MMQRLLSEIPQWVHVFTSLEGEEREIQGIKIWQHHWQQVKGENALVQDPIHGQSHTFSVYLVRENETVVELAAGEFSNNVWGFYVRNRNAA